MVEHERIKEELEETHAKQVRHFCEKPHDPDSTYEASADEEEEEAKLVMKKRER